MTISSVSSVGSGFNQAIDGNEFNALLREIGLANWEKLAGVHSLASAMGAERIRKLQTLNANMIYLADKVGSLGTIDNQSTVVLGANLEAANALKAEFAALGLTVTTDQTYNIATVTKDVNGKSVVGAKRVATAAERTAAEGGTLVTAADANGAEVRSVTVAGVTTTYKLFKQETTLTANKAALDATTTAVTGVARDLMRQVEMSGEKLLAITVEMEEEAERIFSPIKKRELSAADARLAEQREALADRSIRTQERERSDSRKVD